MLSKKNTDFLKIIASILIFTIQTAQAQNQLKLYKGIKIERSATISGHEYYLPAAADSGSHVIEISGNDIVVDFNNVILNGSHPLLSPGEYAGTGIKLNGNNIVIKNARIRGYKIAIMATNSNNLVIEQCDVSYNYRSLLQSTWKREDVSDWMSFHHNENNEWLRYGAGIYLDNCQGFMIRKNTSTNGQCALMISRSNDGQVSENNFSFNSGLGIGMYRSSRNLIIANRIQFNVRGYSHGYYHRGQDSAGLLMFEQCNDNLVAYNNTTHGGDGFFLWAGQTTMDSGRGGCNDNLLYRNDFSFAPTNGVEVTFSRNKIIENIIRECDHGIWGGYSYNTMIAGNNFSGNRIAVAIEHGQENSIIQNQFASHKEAIKLWANTSQPQGWGYAKNRDTRSRDYIIDQNQFTNEALAINLTRSQNIHGANQVNEVKQYVKQDTASREIKLTTTTISNSTYRDSSVENILKKIPLHLRHMPSNIDSSLLNRSAMRITQWGPYNYSYPIIFLDSVVKEVYYFSVLGPAGKWSMKNHAGFKNIKISGNEFPAKITAIKNGNVLKLEAAYSGSSYKDVFGKTNHGNIFSFTEADFQTEWNISWYKWNAETNPNTNYAAFKKLLEGDPLFSTKEKHLDYGWWGKPGKEIPADSFATVATSIINVPAGKYTLSVTADDLVKVFIDGKLVMNFWDAGKNKYDDQLHHSTILDLNGKHEIRIEHAENAGYAALMFYLKPKQ